jgi:hypothetical protein
MMTVALALVGAAAVVGVVWGLSAVYDRREREVVLLSTKNKHTRR